LTTVPVPPSISTLVCALPAAELFSSTVPLLGTFEPPDAEAPLTSDLPSKR
jgi:hypothetical protein